MAISVQTLAVVKLKYPRFKASFHVEILPPDQVMLFDDLGKEHKLQGKPYPLIAKQLLGPKRSLKRMAALLANHLPQEEFYHAIFRLHKKGYIEEADRLVKPLKAFCHLLKGPPSGICQSLKTKSITPHFIGKISRSEFKKKCAQMGIEWIEESVLDVVFVDHYRHRELDRFHERSLKLQKPWLLVQPKGPEIWIGPLFIPKKTPCFQCLMIALKNNQCERVVIEEMQKMNYPISQTIANLPIAEPIAANLAVGEIFKWIVKEENPNIEGKILSLNLCSMELRLHTVLKRSTCKACGADCYPRASSHKFLPLEFSPKTHCQEFMETSTSPFVLEDSIPPPLTDEEIERKYGHLISPITGIVAFVTQVPSVSSPIYNFFGGIRLADVDFLRNFPNATGVQTASGGKGKEEARAKAACLCEAIERHSGVYQGGETKRRATYEEVKESAIHPKSILLFSENQYRIRDEWNQKRHRFHTIPERFNESKSIDWSPCWSMHQKRWKWLPTSFCYYGYHDLGKSGFCRGDSNGCASGNTRVEAVFSGFLELVERDSVALWWYPRLRKPEVDLSSFTDPYIAMLIAYYQSLGRKVWAIDITTDLGIPSIAAFCSDLSGKEILFGFGAHLDAQKALLGALLEMNQGYKMAHWRNGKMLDQNRIDWIASATTENQPYLLPDTKAGKKKYSDYLNRASQNPKGNLDLCLQIAGEKNLEVLILDQTRSHIEMPVVRVVVPGLRHFWNQFGPGRLYDVPHQMGWVKKKMKEEELNPVLMFL